MSSSAEFGDNGQQRTKIKKFLGPRKKKLDSVYSEMGDIDESGDMMCSQDASSHASF